MGLFDRRKPEQHEAPPSSWEAERARAESYLDRARNFTGSGPEDPTLTIRLKPNERALLVATGTFLVEPRRVRTHWSGALAPVTFEVTRRSTVSVPGTVTDPGPTPVDTGDLTFTDKRIVFHGTRQTREWDYAELHGFHHSDAPPWTVLSVQSREPVSGFRYDEGQADEIRFAMALGIARFNDSVDAFVADLQEQLDELDRERPPVAPASPFVGAQPAQSVAPVGAEPAPFGSPWTPPGAFGSVSEPDSGASGASGAAGTEPVPAQQAAEARKSEPAGAGDSPDPTGEIPSVGMSSTAVYPAVQAQAYEPPAQQQSHGQQGQAQQESTGNMPPGWYPDPWGLARVRWWDGYAWTAYTSH